MSDETVWKKVETPKNDFVCKKCNSHNLIYRIKESFCGSYDDIQYRCEDCKHFWVSECSDY